MYIVEGNIGSGKSTFLKLVNEHMPKVSIAYEPLQDWQNQDNGQSLLENFYQDPKRWAYSMETLAMICRARDHMKEQENFSNYRLVERSIYSGHYCFSYNSYKHGFMNDLEWKIYLSWFNFLILNKCKSPLGFIYLKVDPEVAFERIKKRGRSGESKISLDYLKQIDTCHENFLIEKKDLLPDLLGTPVLVLNCNEEFENDSIELEAHLDKIKKFMFIV